MTIKKSQEKGKFEMKNTLNSNQHGNRAISAV